MPTLKFYDLASSKRSCRHGFQEDAGPEASLGRYHLGYQFH